MPEATRDGDGGYVASKELLELVSRPTGSLKGMLDQEWRNLYGEGSIGVDPDRYGDLQQACYFGDAERFKRASVGEDLTRLTTPYRMSFVSILVTGAQRCGLLGKDSDADAQRYVSLLHTLHARGAPLDQPDIGGYTALSHTANHPAHHVLMEALLKLGADPNTLCVGGSGPLMACVTRNDIRGAELLVRHGAGLDVCGPASVSVRALLSRVGPTMRRAVEGAAKARARAVGGANAASSRACAVCEMIPTAPKACSRCHVVFYCSREHQIEHWKHGGHKASCQPGAGADVVVITPAFEQARPDDMEPDELFAQLAFKMPTAQNPMPQMYENPYGDRRANKGAVATVIKVQAGLVPGCDEPSRTQAMLCYTKRRDLEFLIRPDLTPRADFDRVNEAVRTKGVARGFKAYFRGTVRADGKVELRLNEVASESF